MRLKPLNHTDCRAAFRPCFPLYFVHETAHEKVTTARRFQKVLSSRGIGHIAGIEAFALICYFNLHPARDASESHFDLLGVVLFIPVHDGVRDGFADCHVNAESRLIRDATIAREVGRRGGSISNSLNVAGQNESSRLFGHKRRGLPAMGIAVCLLTVQKQNGDGRVTRRLGACQRERKLFGSD